MQNEQEDKTGEGNYRRTSFSIENISMDGTEGVFYSLAAGAEKDDKTGKYPKEAITTEGQELKVVFLKIRRKIEVFGKNKTSMSTSEHNHKGERVMLYGGPNGKEIGTAEEIRTKYPNLRTSQIVYVYLPGKDKIARVTLKGAALGSEGTAKGVLKFYDYLGSFKQNEHSYQFITKLVPVKEDGMKGGYWAVSFQKGDRLDEEQEAKIKTLIDEVHEKVKAVDESLAKKIGAPERPAERAKTPQETARAVVDNHRAAADKDPMDTIEYPEEESNVDDIPF